MRSKKTIFGLKIFEIFFGRKKNFFCSKYNCNQGYEVFFGKFIYSSLIIYRFLHLPFLFLYI